MPIIEIEGKGRVEVEDSFFNLSPEEQARQADEISAAMGESDAKVDPDLSAMDASGETVTLSKQVPEPYERKTVGSDEDFQAALINGSKEAYKDENGVSYDSTGMPLNDFRTETREVKPSEALKDIQNEEGKVTSRAYDGLSYGDALKVYETLANHPDAETDGQTIFLNGSRVPMPEPEFFGDGARVSSVQLGGDGILQAASNLYDLVAAGGNKALSAVGAEESIPLIERQGIEKEGFIDSIQGEAPALLAAGATGLRAANAVVGGTAAATRGAMGEVQIADGLIGKFLSRQNAFVGEGTKAAVRGTGVNSAMVATQNADDSGVFVGDEAIAPIKALEILSTDGRTKSGEILAKKINLLSDAFATGAAASGLGVVGTGLKKVFYDGIIKPMATFGFDSAQHKRVVEEIVMATGNLPVNATPQQQRDYAAKMQNIIEANKDVFAQASRNGQDVGIDVELDPLAAYASALENSTNKADQLEGIRARTVRNDVFSSRLPEPEAKQQTYGEEVQNLQSDLYEGSGGEAGVESARSGIIQAGRNEVSAARGVADSAQADVDKNTSRIEQIFRMDATVGQKLAALEKDGVDINTFRKGNESTEQVVQRITKGETTLRQARDQAYADLADAIPDGVPINDPLFGEKFARAENSLSAETVMKWQDDQINDYKQLRLQVLPDVQQAISRTDPGSDNYRYLIDLERSIKTEQYNNLDAPIKNAIKAQKEEVDRANEAYYNFFQQGPLRDVATSQRRVNTFEASGNKNRSAELTQADRSSNVVDSLFDNSNRNSLQLVGEFLQTPEGGKTAKPLVDIGIAKVVQNSRKTAQTGGIGEIDSQQLISSLSGFASALENVSPQQYKRLQDIISNVRKHEQNGVELERIAKEADDAANKVERQVLDKELGNFFKGSGESRVELSEGQEVFNSIFTNKKNVTNEVNTVINRARQAGPEAVEGVKAAFANSFRVTAQTTPEQIKDASRVLQTARQVYEDEPQVVEALETAFRLTKMTDVAGENRVGLKNIGGNVEQAGILGANRLITMIWGVLNPTATKIRTITSIGAKNFSPRDKMVQVMGEALADTPTFLKMLDDFSKSGVVDDSRTLFDFMVKAGVYSNTDEEFAKFDEALQAEQANQGREPVDDTEDALR